MFQFYDSESTEILDNSQFVQLLKMKWKEIHDTTNVFRYKILNLQERIVDGKYLLQVSTFNLKTFFENTA